MFILAFIDPLKPESIKSFIVNIFDSGFEGVYISFHRPFKNIAGSFEQQDIDINKLFFIDIATALGDELKENNQRCIHISADIEIDELVRALYTSISKLKAQKRFIFIDSLTLITHYKPLSEMLRFSEFLIRTVRSHEVEEVIFNVSYDLSQKKFIQDIALHVDEIVNVVQ